jgi:t-SNARE complex subunit (syntaxin)
VDDSKDSITTGNADLETTIQYQKALRKKWLFCAVIAILVLLAICIPILIQFAKKG